jgi:hypothetical protein
MDILPMGFSVNNKPYYELCHHQAHCYGGAGENKMRKFSYAHWYTSYSPLPARPASLLQVLLRPWWLATRI